MTTGGLLQQTMDYALCRYLSFKVQAATSRRSTPDMPKLASGFTSPLGVVIFREWCNHATAAAFDETSESQVRIVVSMDVVLDTLLAFARTAESLLLLSTPPSEFWYAVSSSINTRRPLGGIPISDIHAHHLCTAVLRHVWVPQNLTSPTPSLLQFSPHAAFIPGTKTSALSYLIDAKSISDRAAELYHYGLLPDVCFDSAPSVKLIIADACTWPSMVTVEEASFASDLLCWPFPSIIGRVGTYRDVSHFSAHLSPATITDRGVHAFLHTSHLPQPSTQSGLLTEGQAQRAFSIQERTMTALWDVDNVANVSIAPLSDEGGDEKAAIAIVTRATDDEMRTWLSPPALKPTQQQSLRRLSTTLSSSLKHSARYMSNVSGTLQFGRTRFSRASFGDRIDSNGRFVNGVAPSSDSPSKTLLWSCRERVLYHHSFHNAHSALSTRSRSRFGASGLVNTANSTFNDFSFVAAAATSPLPHAGNGSLLE